MSTAELDRVYRALADRTRRRLLERLVREPGLTSGDLSREGRNLSRWAILKHLSALRDAGLVQTLEEGRHRRHYPNGGALDAAASWIDELRADSARPEPDPQPEA